MNIIICDDRIDDRKNVSDLLSDYGEKKNYEFTITEYDSGEQLCEDQSALEACQLSAIISWHQYAGDGWAENCYEDQRKISKTSSCTGYGIHERDIGEHMWSPSTIMGILYNEVYIGSVINNKTADNIDTGHQVVQRDKEDWIIVENCHEPLEGVG